MTHIDTTPASTGDWGATSSSAAARQAGTGESAAPQRRRGRGLALWLGLLLAALIAAGGTAYVLTRPAVYSASRTVVVVPASTVSVDQSASLYDSLSRGQVVATAAQLLGQSRWHPKTPDVTVSAGEVAPSSLVLVTARGDDPQQVTSALDEVVKGATPQINTVLKPYAASAVDTQAAQVKKVGLSTPLQLVVVALAALLGGLAVGALVTRMQRRRS